MQIDLNEEFNPMRFMPNLQNEADKCLLVKFYIKPRQDHEESTRQGRPIYKDREYIDIKKPGSRDAVARPATEEDKRRFANHYRAFKDRTNNDENEGTPLKEWPLMSRSMAHELAFFHVKTVEQLVAMSDSQASKFMGLASIREKARVWLEAAEKEKPLWDMEQKIQAQNAEIEELKKALSDVLYRVDAGESEPGEDAVKAARNRRRALSTARKKAG